MSTEISISLFTVAFIVEYISEMFEISVSDCECHVFHIFVHPD